MGRIGVTYQDVATAAQQLQGLSKNPTVDNIRSLLGTGSRGTIARHLKDWKAQQGILSASEGAIPSELLGLVKGLWDRLKETADQHALSYKTESDEKRATAERQRAQELQQNKKLEEERHQLEESLHQRSQQYNQLQQTYHHEQKEKATLLERNTSLESRYKDTQAEVERLHKLLTHVQNNLEHYQSAAQTLRQEQTLLLEKQRNAFENKINQLQQAHALLTTEKLQQQAESEKNKAELLQLHAGSEKTNETLERLNERDHSLSAAQAALQEKYDTVSRQHQQLLQENKDKDQLVFELKASSKADGDKINHLESGHRLMDKKINALRQDNEQILLEKAHLEGQLKQLSNLLPQISATAA